MYTVSAGCNLSPLLFCIYISDLGYYLNSSGLGIALGMIIICAILFADDLLLIGRTEDALKQLMRMTWDYLEYHMVDISIEKSKVMKFDATTGKMIFNG